MKVPDPSTTEVARPESEEEGSAQGIRAPSSPRLSTAPAAVTETQPTWGGVVELRSKPLSRHARELQADLQLLVGDLRRGPLSRVVGSAQSYLSELRREFLRHHRRLAVQVRTPEGCAKLEDLLHVELAELAERFRGVALGRSARLFEAWRPHELVEALDRTVDVLPETVVAPYEQCSFEARGRPIRRAGLRFNAWSRRLLRAAPPTREVRLRQLAHHHLARAVAEDAEGLATLFVQIDVELAARTRIIFEGIARSYDVLGTSAPEELSGLVTRLRKQVEDELGLAEKEVQKISADVARRAVTMFSDAMVKLKVDLHTVGTLDLSNRKRRARKRLRQRGRVLESLDHDLARVRESASGDYALLGLQLEFVAFEARAKRALERLVGDLEADVRGRSFVQLERVQTALREAIEKIDPDEAERSEEELRAVMEPVERVLSEALRGLFQLLEQLEADEAVSPLLDALTRQAQTLTERYRVAAGRLAHAEWKLPPPHAILEVPFRELVSAFVLTDVVPRVLEETNAGAQSVRPFLALCQELERIVTFNTEAGLGDAAAERLDEPGHLQQVVLSALKRRMDTLAEQVARAEDWTEELGTKIRSVVYERLADLRLQLAEGRASELRLDLVRMAHSRRRLLGELDRVTTVIDRIGEQATNRIRGVIGEGRLGRWKSSLGLAPEGELAFEAGQFAPPVPCFEVPIVYRRLFAAQAHWAGDALHQDAVKRARDHLAQAPGMRAVAVVGLDGASKVAMVSAIARGERFGAVKRISLKKPTSVSDVEAILADLPRGHLIVVSGLRWLLSQKPGGFAPFRRLVEGIVADGNQNAWLVESGYLVWKFATEIAPIDSLITEVVRADPLSAEDLETAILARHRLSGYDLVFMDAAGAESVMDDVRSAAQENYFRALFEASGGVLQVALGLWIASLAGVDETAGSVRVGAVPRSPIPELRGLSDRDLLTLYQVARQGWMDGETLAFLFRTDVVSARATLVRLANVGLLERAQKVYQIPPHLRGGVVQALSERGWVE